MSDVECVRCARPVADTGYACHSCATGLTVALLRAATMAGDVAVTVARLARLGEGGRSMAVVPPLPFDWTAAHDARAVINTLLTWARHIAGERGIDLPGTWTWTVDTLPAGFIGPPNRRRHHHPDTRVSILLCWLATQAGWLRMRPEADQAFDELTHATRTIRHIVDTRPVLAYLGPCWTPDPEGTRCDAELYAPATATWVTCRQCGTEHDAAKRREWLLAQVGDVLAHAAQIATALTALGVPLPVGTFYSWVNRGRIIAHGVDRYNRPTYRVGDAIDLLKDHARVAA